MRQEQDIVTPNKGMNLDADPKAVVSKDGEYLSGSAFHMWPKGIPTYMKGNTEVSWDQPLGVNKCIGTFWHNPSNTQFQWHWNSLGNHTIVRYYPKSGTTARRIDIIAQGGEFNLKPDKKISGANMLDDEWLKWVDSGNNRPRQISVKLADNNNKKNKIALYFPYVPNEVDQRVFGMDIILNGTPIVSNGNFFTATSSQVFYFPEMLVAWANAFNATFPQFTATACNDHVELEAANTGNWSIAPSLVDTVLGIIQPVLNMRWEYSNRYNAPWDYRQIDAARFMPVVPPVVSVVSDPKRRTNECSGHVFRFSYYYITVDRHTSPAGPWSSIVYPQQVCSGAYNGNTILIDLNNDLNLTQAAGLGEIDRIHLMVSIDGGPFVLGGDYPKSDWIYTRNILWANDGIYPAIDAAQASETENASPIIAYAQEQFANPTEPENIRIAYGGIKEGHPTPCIPVKLRVRVDEGDLSGSSTVDVEVWVRVCNMFSSASVFQFWYSQPIWRRQLSGPSRIGGFGLTDTDADDCDQITASGGIPVYIAGQRYVAVTEQVVTNIGATSTNFIGGTTVLDGTQLGFNTNAQNLTGRSGIRYCITTGEVYQRAIIKAVPTGQSVVIRVADTRCAFLNDGSLLDLNNPLLAYQTTSTNIFGSQPGPSSASLPLNSREIVLDIPQNASGTIFAGTLLYMDCTTPDTGLVNSCTFKGYIFDDNGNDYVPGPGPGANDIRADGTSMDRTWVGVFPFDAFNNPIVGAIVPNAPGAQYWSSLGVTAAGSICIGFANCTDHNGYYWLPFRKSLLAAGWRMASVSITGDPSNPVGFFAGYTSLGINIINLTLLNDFGDNKWVGTLTTPTLTGPDTNNLDSSGRFKDYIMGNVNPDARDRIRTHVEGRVTDTNGLGLVGASVVLGNGKWVQTQTGGYFSIIAYGSMNTGWNIGNNLNNRIEDSLYYGWTGGCITTFVGGNVQGPVQITQYWDGRAYSEQVPITVLDKEFGFTPANLGAVIGRGTTFPVVLKLYDQHGRQTPVQFLQLVRIPGLTEDLHDFDPIQYPVGTYRFGNAHIDFEILGDVPVAGDVRYIQAQFARGADQRASYRFEWLSTYTTYVVRYDNATDQRVTTTYSSGTATEIWFNIGDGMQRYRDENADSSKVDANGDVVAFGQIGYTFTPGDRVQILTDSNGAFITPLRDYAIRGSIGGSIIIANEPGLPPFTGGEHLRIYTPGATTESELLPYLELPLDTQAIIDPFGTPQWSMPTGELHGGDTYRIPTRVPIRPGFIGTTLDPTASVPWSSRIVVRESPSAIDSIVNVVPSLGRAWFINPQSKYELRGTLIRVSDVWLPGTGTNGSCRFRAGNSGTGNPSCGTITSMNELNGVVGCLCTVKSFAFYPGQTVSQTGDGVFISQGKQILGWIRDYAVEAGTQDPSSVVVERTSAGSWVKFWDARRSQVVRLSVNGFDPMEYSLGQKFNQIDQSYQGKDYVVVAGANTIHKEYWITFEPKSVVVNNIDVDAGAKTLVFYEPTNSWICEYPVMPEMYGRTENEQQTFLNSRMWVQDDNEVRGLFNGTKFPFRIKVVLNSDPVVVSAYKALWVTPASAWEAPLIENLRGQLSSIAPELFEDWEGVSKSAIYCDILSPVQDPLFCGADMRDSIIIIELVNYSDNEVTLFAVDVRKVPSKATLR